MNRSWLDVRKNNAHGRPCRAYIYILRPVKGGRYSFIRKPAGVVIRSHISDSFAVRHRHRYPRFYASNIAHTVSHTPIRGIAGRWGGGQLVSNRDRNRVRDYSLHSLRRIRSTPVNLYIGKNKFQGFMLLTRLIHFCTYIVTFDFIIVAIITSVKFIEREILV